MTVNLCTGTSNERRGLRNLENEIEKFWRQLASKLKDLEKKDKILTKNRCLAKEEDKTTETKTKKGGRTIGIVADQPGPADDSQGAPGENLACQVFA